MTRIIESITSGENHEVDHKMNHEMDHEVDHEVEFSGREPWAPTSKDLLIITGAPRGVKPSGKQHSHGVSMYDMKISLMSC